MKRFIMVLSLMAVMVAMVDLLHPRAPVVPPHGSNNRLARPQAGRQAGMAGTAVDTLELATAAITHPPSPLLRIWVLRLASVAHRLQGLPLVSALLPVLARCSPAVRDTVSIDDLGGIDARQFFAENFVT